MSDAEESMKLIEVTKAFAIEEQCLAYLEAKRWPNGVRCLTCGSKEISRITRKVTKKGMSAMQLQRHLKVNYRTAWYLAHRIREAMLDPHGLKLTGTVEIDETYIGGRQRGHKNKLKNKDVVLGMRQRGGPLRLIQVKDNKQGTLYEAIAHHVDPAGTKAIMTDD